MNCAKLMKRRGIVMLNRKGYIRHPDGTIEPNFSAKVVGRHPVTREPIRKVMPGSARAVLDNAPKPIRHEPETARLPPAVDPFAASRHHGVLHAVIAAVSDSLGNKERARQKSLGQTGMRRGAMRGG